MKKIVPKDLEHFHAWQAHIIRRIDDKGQMAVSTMEFPKEYPVMLVWTFYENVDFESSDALSDVFEYKYVYVGDFPVKSIKKGTYVYQIFQTSDDCCEV